MIVIIRGAGEGNIALKDVLNPFPCTLYLNKICLHQFFELLSLLIIRYIGLVSSNQFIDKRPAVLPCSPHFPWYPTTYTFRKHLDNLTVFICTAICAYILICICSW